MKNRLEIKILLLIIVVLVIGFGTYVIVSISSQTNAMIEQHHEKAQLYGEAVMVGIRNVMLSGKGSYARALVSDARDHLEFGNLKIYDREANEVYPEEGKGIIKFAGEKNVRDVLDTQRDFSSVITPRNEPPVFVRLEPLKNEKECHTCHGANHTVRGVTWVSLQPTLISAQKKNFSPDEAALEVTNIVGNTLEAGFKNIMVSGEAALMDTLLDRAMRLPYIERIQVYDRRGIQQFGSLKKQYDKNRIVSILGTHAAQEDWDRKNSVLTRLFPLKNEDRCQVCHGPKYPWRGVMAISFRTALLQRNTDSLREQLTQMLQSAVGVGFRSIMLVGKGNFVRSFINEVRTISAIRELRVFDRDGNERFIDLAAEDKGHNYAKEVIKSKSVVEKRQSIDGVEYLVRFSPLLNDKRCQACHGSDHQVRGVVAVASSLSPVEAAISQNKRNSLIAGILTILLVWIFLRLFMKAVVVKPIDSISDVARRVGNGDFSVSAVVHSKDEIGQLALRINEMITGLRERFHLQKFVSQQTVDAVKRADDSGVRLGGERKTATVFFTDIRGFTSYSERVEPERVVTMVNTILSKQAEIVKKFGGDIDKFVGDELVAIFEGPSMVRDAVHCAIEIQRKIKSTVAELGEEIGIGIGINTGEMVMGAMGSEDRMDYTVIGDSVNLGARLCSAAPAGKIIISGNSASYLTPADALSLHRLEPIKVKGKEKVIEVYEVEC